MTIARIQADQYRWRRWGEVYPQLGDLTGRLVLDLGCGIGDQSRDLAARGARVVGIDANAELIEHAQRRGIPGAEFRCGEIGDPEKVHDLQADGVWASFVAAYFPSFDRFLDAITPVLASGGWLALTEVDDLFGHEPLAPRWTALVERYYDRSLEEGTYRFRSHDHVHEVLARREWRIKIDRTLDDDELAFDGPADPDVIAAWQRRLALMMPRFRQRFGEEVSGFAKAFLDCLASIEHRSRSRVWFTLARAASSTSIHFDA